MSSGRNGPITGRNGPVAGRGRGATMFSPIGSKAAIRPRLEGSSYAPEETISSQSTHKPKHNYSLRSGNQVPSMIPEKVQIVSPKRKTQEFSKDQGTQTLRSLNKVRASLPKRVNVDRLHRKLPTIALILPGSFTIERIAKLIQTVDKMIHARFEGRAYDIQLMQALFMAAQQIHVQMNTFGTIPKTIPGSTDQNRYFAEISRLKKGVKELSGRAVRIKRDCQGRRPLPILLKDAQQFRVDLERVTKQVKALTIKSSIGFDIIDGLDAFVEWTGTLKSAPNLFKGSEKDRALYNAKIAAVIKPQRKVTQAPAMSHEVAKQSLTTLSETTKPQPKQPKLTQAPAKQKEVGNQAMKKGSENLKPQPQSKVLQMPTKAIVPINPPVKRVSENTRPRPRAEHPQMASQNAEPFSRQAAGVVENLKPQPQPTAKSNLYLMAIEGIKKHCETPKVQPQSSQRGSDKTRNIGEMISTVTANLREQKQQLLPQSLLKHNQSIGTIEEGLKKPPSGDLFKEPPASANLQPGSTMKPKKSVQFAIQVEEKPQDESASDEPTSDEPTPPLLIDFLADDKEPEVVSPPPTYLSSMGFDASTHSSPNTSFASGPSSSASLLMGLDASMNSSANTVSASNPSSSSLLLMGLDTSMHPTGSTSSAPTLPPSSLPSFPDPFLSSSSFQGLSASIHSSANKSSRPTSFFSSPPPASGPSSSPSPFKGLEASMHRTAASPTASASSFFSSPSSTRFNPTRIQSSIATTPPNFQGLAQSKYATPTAPSKGRPSKQ